MIGTMRHIETMKREDLTAAAAWRECLREASNPRFDKRTGLTVPIGVFVEAKATMKRNRPDLAAELFPKDAVLSAHLPAMSTKIGRIQGPRPDAPETDNVRQSRQRRVASAIQYQQDASDKHYDAWQSYQSTKRALQDANRELETAERELADLDNCPWA